MLALDAFRATPGLRFYCDEVVVTRVVKVRVVVVVANRANYLIQEEERYFLFARAGEMERKE